jgi:hypothetical protein
MDWYTSEKTMYVRQNEIMAEVAYSRMVAQAQNQEETTAATRVERISPFTRLLTVLRLKTA